MKKADVFVSEIYFIHKNAASIITSYNAKIILFYWYYNIRP